MAKIIIDVCWKDKKFVEDLVKKDYEVGSMFDTEIRTGLKEAVVVSSEQDIVKPYLDEIRTEIEEQVLESLSDGGDDWFTAEKVNECLDIIDKYKTESER